MAFPIATDATYVNQSTYADASELRRADAIFTSTGVVRSSDTALAVSVNASDQVTIQPGTVVIPGTGVGGGVYRTGLSAASSGHALTARNATNPRIDLIVYEMKDQDVDGSGLYVARLNVVTGTAAASPSAPALGAMQVELARINVPASGGGTATVDASYRTYATPASARIEVPTAARLPASAPKYARAVALDFGAEYIFDGTSWSSNGELTWHTVGGGGEPAFQNSWVAAAGSVQFRKDLAGNLHIRGIVTGGASGTVVFTLPTGSRPSAAWSVPVTNNVAGLTQMDVATDGTVKLTNKIGSGTIHNLNTVLSLV